MAEILLPPRKPFWTRARIRSVFVQAAFVAVLVWLFRFLFSNMMANLQRQGIASRFGFPTNRAGFDVALNDVPSPPTRPINAGRVTVAPQHGSFRKLEL